MTADNRAATIVRVTPVIHWSRTRGGGEEFSNTGRAGVRDRPAGIFDRTVQGFDIEGSGKLSLIAIQKVVPIFYLIEMGCLR